MDADGYPEDYELDDIRCWTHERGWGALMVYVRSLWAYNYFYRRGRKYYLHTVGWSGNEDIVRALEANEMFWLFCWVSSERGGHYVFEIPA
jgi:hypothetical protein